MTDATAELSLVRSGSRPRRRHVTGSQGAGDEPGSTARDLGQFVELLERRDRQGALAQVVALTERSGVDHVITHVLAPAQAEVGARWESGRWTVSQEHAASAIVQNVLETVGNVPRGAGGLGHVVVGCVEDEWHSLPAQMFGELLRSQGWDVEFLGASVSPHDLPDFLADVQPDAVALSCSVAMNFPGAARVIDAAHFAGAPVLVGGRALTHDRSVALGADGYVTDAADASALLTSWRDGLDRLASPGRPGAYESATLAHSTNRIVDAAMEQLLDSLPVMRDFTTRQIARTRADYAYILRFLAAAVLIEDLTVYSEFLDWLQGILVARGLPGTVLPLSLNELDPLLAPFPVGRRFNEACARELATDPAAG